jgi:predicted Holliday junction resolvase-like endonuclease
MIGLVIALICVVCVLVVVLYILQHFVKDSKRLINILADKDKIIMVRDETIASHGKILQENRADAIKRSRSVLEGKFSEQLSPLLPQFKYDPTDVRFLGSPIDLLIFDGLSTGECKRVIFMEVKTGKSKLSERESVLKDVINDKKVSWELMQINLEEGKSESSFGKES